MNLQLGVQRVFAAILFQLAVAAAVFAQAPAAELWSGRAQCQVTVQSPGYVHQETQTWEIGGAPSQVGAMQVYPATWSTTGQGSAQRTLGVQMLSGQWSTNVRPMATTLAVFVRASDRRLIIKSTHVQMTAPNATMGIRQVAAAGVPPAQTAIPSTGYEWPFPAIEDAETSTAVNGTGGIIVSSNYLPMQNAGSSNSATCTWKFRKGAQNQAVGTAGTSQPLTGTAGGVASSTPSIRTANTQSTTGTGAGLPGTINTGGGQSCMALASGAAQALGTLAPGSSTTYSGNMASTGDYKILQFSLTAGTDANITVSGVPPGSDFDLYVYRSDQTSIGCSMTRGTGDETVTTKFGNSQTGNTVYVQISAYAWDASVPGYKLTVSAPMASTPGSQTTSLRNPLPVAVQQGVSNPNACPAISSGLHNAQALGTLAPGTSTTYSGNMASTGESKILQFNLLAGTEANLTLEGVPDGSDFDLYVYRSDQTPIGCSITRGTGTETVTTKFGNSQTSNTVYVQINAYAWNASAPGYKLTVSAPMASTPGSQTTSLRNPLPVAVQRGVFNPNAGLACPAISAGLQSAQALGTLAQGFSTTYSGNMASTGDYKILQFSLTAGTDANITVSGVPPGSDFDLYVYRSDQTSIGCSMTRGTGDETVTTKFGNSQTGNTVYVQISAYAWDASVPGYKVRVQAVASVAATQP